MGMSVPSPVIAQSLEYLGQGVYLLIGILVALLFLGTIGLAVLVALRVHCFHRRQRLAREAYRQRTRRADGKMYPPHTGGICEHCGRVRKVVYHLPGGEKLCHECYELWWPMAERVSSCDSVPMLTGDRAAAALQNRPVQSGGRKPGRG